MTQTQKPLQAAATVILARPAPDNSQNYQIFMVRRSTKSAFMPDVFVFPGGKLDEADTRPEALNRLVGLTADKVFRDTSGIGSPEAELPLTPEQTAGLWLAAVRELFEEAGVLLATNEDSTPPVLDFAALSNYRKALQKGELSFTQMLEQEKLCADAGRLTYFSHWITPLSEPRRFDTRFFLAVVEAEQEAAADLYELTEGYWLTPAEALARAAEGNFTLMFPTLLHVQRMADRPTLPELVEYARTKEIVSVMPGQVADKDFRVSEEVLRRW